MTSGSSNKTINIIDGKKVIPCRCGTPHSGDYAEEDWNHHNCFHETDLVDIGHASDDGVLRQVLCMDCGNSWIVRPPRGSASDA